MKTYFKNTLKHAGWMILLWGIVSIYADQFLVQKVTNELASPNGASPIVWLWAFLSMCLSLISPLVLTVMILSGISGIPFIKFIRRNFEQLLIEEMRSFGKAFLWSFLLFIPGLLKFLQFLFIPMVIVGHPGYHQGKIDALKMSTQVFNKYWGRTLAVVFGFGIVFPLLLSAMDEYQSFTQNLWSAVFLAIIQTLGSVISVTLMWKIWEKFYGTNLQLARH